jgi:SAM-dependent methyltransferase
LSTGSEQRMRRFWDRRAEEDAFYFVDNTLDYRSPDVERFWADGEQTIGKILSLLGVELRPTDSVVEIGCGVGRLTRAIAARSADVRALDISERMLELAREHNPALGNVVWILGDGSSLAPIESESATACISHVVFQHIEDPAITLGYIREIGRVLRPGGWAAFQVSNDRRVHSARRGWTRVRQMARALTGRAPRGQAHPAWLGSHVELDDVRRAAADGEMDVERVVGEGTQFCMILARRRLRP